MVVILPVLHLHLCSPEEQQKHLLAQWMQKVDELKQRIHILYQFSIPTLILDRQTMVIFSDLLYLSPFAPFASSLKLPEVPAIRMNPPDCPFWGRSNVTYGGKISGDQW